MGAQQTGGQAQEEEGGARAEGRRSCSRIAATGSQPKNCPDPGDRAEAAEPVEGVLPFTGAFLLRLFWVMGFLVMLGGMFLKWDLALRRPPGP